MVTTTSTTTTLPQGDFFNDCVNATGLCDPREICVTQQLGGYGVCALPCTTSAECPAAEVETAPVDCIVPSGSPSVCMQTCTGSGDCPGGMSCLLGACYWAKPT